MKIAVSAYPITFHADFSAWQLHFEAWVKAVAPEQPDVIVFPEYGSIELVSIFPEEIRRNLIWQIQEMQGLWEGFQSTCAALAKKYNCILVAPSFPLKIDDHFVNRVTVYSPDGTSGYQDKFFMTPFERFEWHIASGEKVLTVFETAKGSFGVQICYDGEFSVGSRLLVEAGADVLLMPSCTEAVPGATRVHVGARARALENQCYTLVSQTIGSAEWSPAVDINYGFTAAYSTPDVGLPPTGILQQQPPQEAGWLVQELDFERLRMVRLYGGVRNFADHEMVVMGLKEEVVRVRRVVL